MTVEKKPAILDGVRIIDLTSVVFGPLATQMLGDLGADVIKVEGPEGDLLRNVQPSQNKQMGAAFLGSNRNKRSVVIDLKSQDGRDQLRKLLADADVMISSIRPAALARLSLDPETLRRENPSLITVAATGYGQDGPYAAKPAFDDIVQSVSGLASLATLRDPNDAPAYAPTILADKLGGVTAAYAVMAALFHRERTGEAQHVEVPMFETLTSFLLAEHLDGATFEETPQDFGYDRMLVPHRRPVRTADGYITILPYTNLQWARFFKAVGRDDMVDHIWVTDMAARSRNIGAVYDMVAQVALTRTTEEWLTLTEEADIPAMPVRNLADLPGDPHLAATGFFQRIEHPSEGPIWTTRPPVRFSATPARHDHRPAPRLGEHTEEILGKDDD
ncbi:CaiB/BaiF CoA transferase family protein [Pontivivens nitratireducens]|uniref:CoA transferase n=1 Tax=Pontivivens nitratireducens TaxID=2758038 RepID=A0A6G7VI43_9RHOB|nr:CoA transferase [Pontibrevibacter nitratireducens]QIK39763.1 CoA transferase [Pontibrevibacter nitratireducens]